MGVRFHVFIMMRPINYTLTIRLRNEELEHLLDHDVSIDTSTGNPDIDEYFHVTLHAVAEAIRQIDSYNKLDDAVGLIYDVNSHRRDDDGHVSQEANVKVFGSYAMFEKAKDSYQRTTLH
jgi:hypothetical protein